MTDLATSPSSLIPIVGTLDPYFETGTEGVVWSIHALGLLSYNGLNCLKDGDLLVVPAGPGYSAWQGEIKFEYQNRRRPHPFNPQYQQQEIKGLWVRGLQDGLNPERWGDYFFKQRPATLYRSVEKLRTEKYFSASNNFYINDGWRSLLHDPHDTYNKLKHSEPDFVKDMASSVIHFWTYTCEHIGWDVPIDFSPQVVADPALYWQKILIWELLDVSLRQSEGLTERESVAKLGQQWHCLANFMEADIPLRSLYAILDFYQKPFGSISGAPSSPLISAVKLETSQKPRSSSQKKSS